MIKALVKLGVQSPTDAWQASAEFKMSFKDEKEIENFRKSLENSWIFIEAIEYIESEFNEACRKNGLDKSSPIVKTETIGYDAGGPDFDRWQTILYPDGTTGERVQTAKSSGAYAPTGEVVEYKNLYSMNNIKWLLKKIDEIDTYDVAPGVDVLHSYTVDEKIGVIFLNWYNSKGGHTSNAVRFVDAEKELRNLLEELEEEEDQFLGRRRDHMEATEWE